MEPKYNGLRDRHLNIFYTYGDKAHLENNITKAFINVLQSLNDQELKETVKALFDFDLPNGTYTTTFYLLTKPKEDLVKQYLNRIMFAFSPTGKSWGFEGLDIKNEKEIRKVLEEEAKKRSEIEEEQKDYVTYTLEEILETRKNKGSIPDGWLFIDVNGKPVVVIAMENKLYDLNPYQLNNHIEKSLLITKSKQRPVYRKYEDIVSLFKQFESYIPHQFIEYLIILNYIQVDDFSLACGADKEIRQKLALRFGKEILDHVHEGKKDFRHWYCPRCHVNYEYLREINLSFEKDEIELWLSFGPTQSTAKKMLSCIDRIDICDPRFFSYQGFHLLYKYPARIIKGSYVSNWELDEYIDYWKANIKYVKTSTPKEAIELYKKLHSDGKIDKSQLDDITQRFIGKKSLIIVAPEISLVFKWTYEEAAMLGIEGFAKEIKDKLNIALTAMKLI